MTSPNADKSCVYTSIIGGYEPLNEQPIARESGWKFICLTDDPNLASDTWEVRLVDGAFGMDPIRSQRDIKLRPHRYLPDFTNSLYIDNTVLLTAKPEEIAARYLTASGFSVPWHSYRKSVLDEFVRVSQLGMDEPSRIFEQLNHYQIESPSVLEERPLWGGFLLRHHAAAQVIKASEIWHSHVLRYARRDQLSLNYSLRRAEIAPTVIEEDNYESWFHSRLRDNPRQWGDVRRPLKFMSPPAFRVRELELELADARHTYSKELRQLTDQLAASAPAPAAPASTAPAAYEGPKEASSTEGQHAIHEHWSKVDSYDANWDRRAQMAVSLAGSMRSAIDLGCGARMSLRNVLPEGVVYQACDIHRWTSDVIVRDLGALEFPVNAILTSDVTFALGLLEYLPDVPAFFERLGRYCRRLAFSYCSTDAGPERHRLWVNHYSGAELSSLAGLGGFRIVASKAPFRVGQYILYAENQRMTTHAVRKAVRIARPGAALSRRRGKY